MLGTNWLSKLGIFILVLGVAFFLTWELRELGPAGKDAVGFVVSACLLGAGIWGERAERYRLLARAAVAGGWSLLFFTAYAMYHVAAARVLSSPASDLAVMLAVAAAMVAHTLQYRSQTVTSLAFLTAFSTLIISRADVYSLSASAVLAVALVAVVLRMRWYHLELFGIAGVYLAHFFWLRPIILAMHGHRHAFPEFLPSAAILLCYWAAFRASYLLRKTDVDEKLSTFAALLNTCFLLSILKYQSVHPEWAFWALLAMGAVEMGLGQLPMAKRRRMPFVVLSTIGAAQLVAAIPFHFGPQYVSSIWLIEGEALLVLGLLTRERVFRVLGMLAGVALGMQMLAVDAARVYGARMDSAYVVREPVLGGLFLLAAAVLYINSLLVPRRWPEMFADAIDRLIARRLSYAGEVLAFVSGWIAFPIAGAAVAWMLAAALLAWIGTKIDARDLCIQADLIACASIVRVLAINLHLTTHSHFGRFAVSNRLWTTVACAALVYWTSRRSKIREWELGRYVPAIFTWSGSALVSLLLWYELRPSSVAMAWGLFGLALLELGILRSSRQLRLQGLVALASAFLRIFIVDLNGAEAFGEISSRIYSVVPLCAAFYYAYFRTRDKSASATASENLSEPAIYSYFGSLAVLGLIRFETPLDWIVTAWAALIPLLFVLAWRSDDMIFREQGGLVAIAVLFRAIEHNFYERSYFHAPLRITRIVCVGGAVVLAMAAIPICRKLRSVGAKTESEVPVLNLAQKFFQRSDISIFYIAVVLLTTLLGVEMRHGMVTASWGLEAVAVFLFALWIGERSYRLTGLALLFLAVGKIIVIDVWRLNTPDRALTFIVLGAALLSVSLLYTRNREAIRQLL